MVSIKSGSIQAVELTGICVQRLSNGTIFAVLVEDAEGKRLSLDPETYLERNLSPDIFLLPTRIGLSEV